MNAILCSHCALPIRGQGQRREIVGEVHGFCCYGCCLAYQIRHGEHEEPEAARLLIRLGVGAFLAMNIMLFSLLLYSGSLEPGDPQTLTAIHVVLWLLASPTVLILGGPFMQWAWRAAREGRTNADTLVSLGVVAAYGYSAQQVVTGGTSVYFDTATMVLVLFTFGRYLEAAGRVRAVRSLAPMLAAERATAMVMTEQGDTELPVRAIEPGKLVRVRPGERLAVDGLVIEGTSRCDEAVLTGQFEPVSKFPGTPVYAGSVNGTGQLIIRVTVAGGATRWGQIARQVREALGEKGMAGEIVDRVAAAFVPAVLLLAGGTVAYWSGQLPMDDALTAGLAVLVVACPCALGLAAPLAAAIGLGQAARQGVVVRGYGALERIASLKGVAFDKTGTLTAREVEVVAEMTADEGETELLRRAAGLAIGSDHPVARGIVAAMQAKGGAPAAGSNLRSYPGEGMGGTVASVHTAVGSAGFMNTLGWSIPEKLADHAHSSAFPSVYVGWGGRVRGVLSVADAPLSEAPRVIAALRELGIETCVLSGDSRQAAERTADAMGIVSWCAELSPAGKVEALRDWARRIGPVAMVGDGLNDGPVLASAPVGIAVGGASDLARESADVTLPENALEILPDLIRLARRVRGTIMTNIAWALGYNMVALSLAAAGLLHPIIAAALMAGSSLLVVANSLQAGRKPVAPVRTETGDEVRSALGVQVQGR